MYHIEKGVPLTPSPRSTMAAAIMALKPGDSFTAAKSEQCKATVTGRRMKIKVRTRAIDEATIRVWRVE